MGVVGRDEDGGELIGPRRAVETADWLEPVGRELIANSGTLRVERPVTVDFTSLGSLRFRRSARRLEFRSARLGQSAYLRRALFKRGSILRLRRGGVNTPRKRLRG